ncbi:MAG: RNA polymerase-binding protein RbpA [Microbacteriaceae bacterium]
MASGGSAIRGTRVGSGPMGEQDRGIQAERVAVSYWDIMGNETVRHFSAQVEPEDIPETIDSPTTGLPAGRDKNNPPQLAVNEPYKTHLAYVKERRTESEAKQILDDALLNLRTKKGRT